MGPHIPAASPTVSFRTPPAFDSHGDDGVDPRSLISLRPTRIAAMAAPAVQALAATPIATVVTNRPERHLSYAPAESSSSLISPCSV
jgi:hypothetical protein